MNSDWASENLQTIRLLMERSALYRRALAPLMIYTGLLGAVAGVAGHFLRIDSGRGFLIFWMAIAVAAATGSFLLVRQQALRESEPFWSPPARRIAHAMLPPLLVGLVSGLLALTCPAWDYLPLWGLPIFWMLLYGTALTAAGFFVNRSLKLLGWAFILFGCLLMTGRCWASGPLPLVREHLLMGTAFGGLHLIYGVYLAYTESRRNRS